MSKAILAAKQISTINDLACANQTQTAGALPSETTGTEHLFLKHVNPNLGRLLSQLEMDKVYVRGEGCYLYDRDGTRYLDFLAQYGALPFGFNHPHIWRAIEQVRERGEPSFIQPSLLTAASELAQKLIEIAPPGLQYVTFANSGAEAIEAAIKLCKSTVKRAGILAAGNGFHGKTLGALSATDKKKYQKGFGAPVHGYDYVPFGDADALERALASGYYAAFLVEPLQGEGGIIEAPPGYLKRAREICTAAGTLLVVDEVQTGLGRTGAMFACDAEEVTPDVLTLAKALGGGIMPIGACLCTARTYNEDFALKHTSTFAGNTLACRVGLATIEVLEGDDRALIRQVAANGARLKKALLALQQKYPHLIAEVRGRGYMLGIRFGITRYNYDSGLLGCLGETEVLTSLVVSYMLNLDGVRLGYTLNQGGVLRIEPPLIATWAECELFLAAFERALVKLDERNTANFTAHLTGLATVLDEPAAAGAAATVTPITAMARRLPVSAADGRFAFLLHPLTESNYADIDPSLRVLSAKQIRRLAGCVADNFDPFVIGDARIVSDTGQSAYGEFIIVPRTARELVGMPAADAFEEIQIAAQIAKQRGAKIIGLGAYTSVITRGGLLLKDEQMPALTTGNSYTAVTGRQSIEEALRQMGRSLAESTVAVVGAAGSIGRAISILLARDAGKLILIGNPSDSVAGKRRIMKVAGEILYRLWQSARQQQQGAEFAEGSLAARLASRLPGSGAQWTKAEWVKLAEAVEPLNLLYAGCDSKRLLPLADVIVTATSAVDHIVTSEHLKEGAVVCDISRPGNISRETKRNRRDVFVIDGGVVRLPGASTLNFNTDLDVDLAYACMAETMILALEQRYADTSLGIGLDMAQVLEFDRLAERHGFKVVVHRPDFESETRRTA